MTADRLSTVVLWQLTATLEPWFTVAFTLEMIVKMTAMGVYGDKVSE